MANSGMMVRFWGVRGSIACPGPGTMRYGGNTSCIELTLSDGSEVILDAGTGIRDLGRARKRGAEPVHVLLTHLHNDHFDPAAIKAVTKDRGFGVVCLASKAIYRVTLHFFTLLFMVIIIKIIWVLTLKYCL